MTQNFFIRPVTSQDSKAITAISQDVGWNQPEEEIQEIIDRSEKFIFGAFQGDALAGIAAAYCYPEERVAFLNEVIVHSTWRHKGAATQLLQELISSAQPEYPVMRLYATELGRPLYAKFGFEPYGTLSFCEFSQEDSRPSPNIIRATEENLPAICELDKANLGLSRMPLLKKLLKEAPVAAWCKIQDGQLQGFILRGPMSWCMQSRNINDLTELVLHANHHSGTAYPVCLWKEVAEELPIQYSSHFELTAMQLGNVLPPPPRKCTGTLPDIG